MLTEKDNKIEETTVWETYGSKINQTSFFPSFLKAGSTQKMDVTW